MFTTWQQIEDWIKDNQFDHWIFSRSRIGSDEKFEKIVDSDYYAGDYADKLAMTKKYLESNGGISYGYGYRKATGAKGATSCEARIEQYAQPANGVGAIQAPVIDEAAIEKRIREQIEAKMAKERYEEERKNFEREKREFEKEKAGVWGVAIKYLSPIAAAMQQRAGLSHVAGTEEPVTVDPIQPLHAARQDDAPEQAQIAEQAETEAPENAEQSPFTDEEADELFELLARFKKAEPDYLPMIRKVVEMAEAGDNTYKMAKGFLIK